MGAYHAGEAAAQDRVGMRERMAEVATRAIRDHMPDQHREFFPLLPFLVVGSLDATGQPWGSVLANAPGFAHSPEPTHLAVRARALPGDPLALKAGAPVGLLGIQTHTRRRNRMNGLVESIDGDGFTVAVQQSFGNCPKYITPREAVFTPSAAGTPRIVRSHGLDDRARAILDGADTLFIATAHPDADLARTPEEGVDVSHRGGPPGFLARDDEDVLRLPDYAGNFFFNTFGNLGLNPRAGLLVLDRERAGALYLAVRGTVVWAPERHVRFEVDAMVRTEGTLPLSWHEPQ